MIRISRAQTFHEKRAVYRFRYSVYVEEMGRRQKYADHARRLILDPLDVPSARLHAAWHGGEVVGTVRSNFLSEGDVGEYAKYYDLRSIPFDESRFASITTRLMIHPQYRGSTLALRLASTAFRDGARFGISTDFIDCNDHLIDFFTGLGYRTHRANLNHPEYGPVTVMRLDLRDIDHLQRIRSPFRRCYCDSIEGGGRTLTMEHEQCH